jgi:putative hemolysin
MATNVEIILKNQNLLQAQPNLRYFGGVAFAKFLMHLLKLKKINKIYTEFSKESGISFVEKLLESIDIKYEVSEADLKRIPATGGFIIVSNHPFGGLDGILLLKVISAIRPDIKVLANFLLTKIEPLQEFFLGVNPFEERKDAKSSFGGLKMAIQHVRDGGVLGIFPAGEVSSYDNYYNITDKEWQYPVIKLIKSANIPVVPVYFFGSNSRLFHWLGIIHPRLRTIKLPSEFFNKKNKTINIRIGNPIRSAEIQEFNDINQLGRYLRAKTYCLGLTNKIEVKKFFWNTFKQEAKKEEIIAPVKHEILISEVDTIREEHTLFRIKNYSVFCCKTKLIPNIFQEIGRLREITFRLVGEGTNHSIDIDEYDLYYNQLFIWDEDKNCIVGAYRLGLGNEIIEHYGIHGFYLNSLFRLNKRFAPILSQSLELGRSFVVQEYQRKPLPLFLLWKGILYFLLKNPQYRYLLGPVSISNNYSQVSKDSIIRFITTNYFRNDLAKLVKPRKAYTFISEDPNINLLLDNVGSDLNKFDKFIGDIDKLNYGIPVLLKKYLSLNAKILAFNVDPNFNNCLDGLIILDIYDVPQNTIESLSKEVNDGTFLERFYSSRELVKTESTQ